MTVNLIDLMRPWVARFKIREIVLASDSCTSSVKLTPCSHGCEHLIVIQEFLPFPERAIVCLSFPKELLEVARPLGCDPTCRRTADLRHESPKREL
jgi:hypothetical protein